MADAFKYSGERKSFQSFNEPYFRTSVIKDWKHLLKNDEMKMIIIKSLIPSYVSASMLRVLSLQAYYSSGFHMLFGFLLCAVKTTLVHGINQVLLFS